MSEKKLVVKNSQVEQWEGTEKLLTQEGVKNYLCPKASDSDLYLFITFCKSRHLNPFIREAYLVKYSDTAPASIVTSKDTFFKRAESISTYDGIKSGIIFRKGTQIICREGYCLVKELGETLVGGWAEVYRRDRKIPTRVEVSMQEYEGKKFNWKTKTQETNSMWKNKPATMITKVAEVQALRKTFPNDFMGMYTPEESLVGKEELSQEPVDLKKIKDRKETVIDVGEVEEKKEPEKKATKPFEKKEPEKKAPKKKEPEKKEPKKAVEKKEEKLSPLEKKLGELYNLVNLIPIDDLKEKAKVLVTLQKTLKIPGDKKMMDYTKEDAEAMILLIKKQFPEEAKEAPEKEEKRVLRKDEVLCVDCKKNVLRKDTATYKYSMKNFGEPVCYNCGQARRKK